MTSKQSQDYLQAQNEPNHFALTPACRMELSGGWHIHPIPLDADAAATQAPCDAVNVPDCVHLQPFLYPARPYWGDHLRAINDQAWLYRKTFRVSQNAHQYARMGFEGVDYFADVWLNDQFLGHHEGNFAPFEFDVTQVLRVGDDNHLTVRVTSPWDAPNPGGTYPSSHVVRGLVKGLYEHGEGVIPPAVNPIGIWRPVALIFDDGVHVESIRIRTQLNGRIDLNLRLINRTGSEWNGQLVLHIEPENHDGSGITDCFDVSLTPNLNEIAHTVTLPDPRLWWCWDHGDPNLYRLSAVLMDESGRAVASESRVFGVRTVRLERSPDRFTFFLNERPIALRGTTYMSSLYLSQTTCESLERDIQFVREANLNLLRAHVHVAPPEFYDRCDRAGVLVWQDFELNWIHDDSLAFERRALAIQRNMIDLLNNHPSVMMWACHNEPTMVLTRRSNLESHPDPALYADAVAYDPTRPLMMCSGQMDADWRRSGDSHWYYGAIWSKHYTDIRRHRPKLLSEFGFEAPASSAALRRYADVWERLRHLENDIDGLWDYQAALIQYQVEYVRRMRAHGCAGYVHFALNDLVPQVGCGVLDADRNPKGGYAALKGASQPLLIALDYDERRPIALWVCNDTMTAYPGARVCWSVFGEGDTLLFKGEIRFDIAANASQRVTSTDWKAPQPYVKVCLTLMSEDGVVLAANHYDRPFARRERPRGYPWKFDPYLGTKVFNRADAPSLADYGVNGLVKWIPLQLREALAERGLRMHLPIWVASALARLGDRFFH